MSETLRRSRKQRHGHELLCEEVFRPLAHLLVLPLARLRTPPPLVAIAAAATGVAAAVELGRGHLLACALLLQLKTLLDNADGQLARLSGRVTMLGRYLDSELDLLVNAALFTALGSLEHAVALPLVGFLVLTAVLSIDFNAERLHQAERVEATPTAPGRAATLLRGVYALLYGWQDALVERGVERRLRGRSAAERRAFHDGATVTVLANLGLSTQLATFGVLIALGRPAWFVWLLLFELLLVAALALRRETLLHRPAIPHEETT